MKLKNFLKITAINIVVIPIIVVSVIYNMSSVAYGIFTGIELIPQTVINSDYPLSQEVKDEIKMASSKFKPNGYDYSKPAMFEKQEEYQADDV